MCCENLISVSFWKTQQNISSLMRDKTFCDSGWKFSISWVSEFTIGIGEDENQRKLKIYFFHIFIMPNFAQKKFSNIYTMTIWTSWHIFANFTCIKKFSKIYFHRFEHLRPFPVRISIVKIKKWSNDFLSCHNVADGILEKKCGMNQKLGIIPHYNLIEILRLKWNSRVNNI